MLAYLVYTGIFVFYFLTLIKEVCLGIYTDKTITDSNYSDTKHFSIISRYFQILTSGFFAGVCTTVIMAPGERIKCLLQVGE